MKKQLFFVLAVAMILSLAAGFSQQASTASNYPQKPIQVVVPYAPGGDLDFNARAYTQFLREVLGQPVVVVNVEGGSGIIGTRKAKDAAPDGYTVVLSQPSLMINKIAGTQDFGLEAFEMVGIAAYVPGDIITVNAKSGFKTLKDLVKYAKENPGKLKVAASLGTMNYIEALQMVDAGMDINIVNAGDATARVAALKGGHIDVILNSYGTVADYLKTGDFVALGTTNDKRNKAFKKISTCKEQGYDISFDKYLFFAMPKGTPREFVNKFSAAVKKVSKKAEYAKLIYDTYGQVPYYKPADESLKLLGTLEASLQKYKERLAPKK